MSSATIPNMSITASAACGTCRKQKKKCDKKLPCCSRCLFVLKECKYEDKSAIPVVTTGYTKPPPYEITLAQPHWQLHCPDIDYHVVHNTFLQNDNSELHIATVGYVLKLLSSSGLSIESMLNKYLRTIGTWLPVISRKRLYQSVSSMLRVPRAEFALLLLSMHLALQPPPHQSEVSPSSSSTYCRVKQLFALLQSANFMSIDVVQSALLITTYEYGHGYSQSAFLSIGTCARMAHMLEWHKNRISTNVADSEEGIRVWWGIRAFERLLDLEPRFSTETLTPDTNMTLPTEDEDWDLPLEGISTNSPFPQTAFLQAQGARLLGRAISLTTNHSLSGEDSDEHENRLKATLVQFAVAVADSSRDEWGANCGTLGLTYSAIYHLHFALCIERSTMEDTSSLFELRRTTRIVVDIARTFCLWYISNKDEADPGRCLPLTLQTLRHACITHIELAGTEFQSREWKSDLKVMTDMLDFIRARWTLAGKILHDVQEAYDTKVRESNDEVRESHIMENRI